MSEEGTADQKLPARDESTAEVSRFLAMLLDKYEFYTQTMARLGEAEDASNLPDALAWSTEIIEQVENERDRFTDLILAVENSMSKLRATTLPDLFAKAKVLLFLLDESEDEFEAHFVRGLCRDIIAMHELQTSNAQKLKRGDVRS